MNPQEKPWPPVRLAKSNRAWIAAAAILIVILSERLGITPEQFMDHVVMVATKLGAIVGVAIYAIYSDTRRPM